MAVTLYNDWYISPEWSDVGPSSGGSSAYQEHNAQKIYEWAKAYNWTDNAIAGMLGNIQVESGFDPACVYPKIGNTLAAIDNDHAKNNPNNAYGLVQWKGLSSAQPITNQIVSYAIRYGYQWYDGEIQLRRLTWEFENKQKWIAYTIDGIKWTFDRYAYANESPEQLAEIWLRCYERTSTKSLPARKNNANYWYQFFSGSPISPEWISGHEFASLALSYDGEYMPYDLYDCIAFVDTVWHDISSVPSNITLGQDGSRYGTNTLWRINKYFQTTDPWGNFPTNELWGKMSIAECINQYGGIPTGSLLFHKISNAGPPPIPSYYANDGIGNFAHVGIYCGDDQVMQSGGRDSGSVPGGGVHLSAYDPDAWSHVAFLVYVDVFSNPDPGPEPEPPLHPATIRQYICATQQLRNRKVIRNVRWKF